MTIGVPMCSASTKWSPSKRVSWKSAAGLPTLVKPLLPVTEGLFIMPQAISATNAAIIRRAPPVVRALLDILGFLVEWL